MACGNRVFRAQNRWLSILFVGFSFLFFLGSIYASEDNTKNEKLGLAGTIDIPKAWLRTDNTDGSILLQDSAGVTGAKIFKVKDVGPAGMTEWLRNRAHEIGIPDFVRGIDPDLKEDVGAQRGSFVLGTVRLGGDSIYVKKDVMDEEVEDQQNEDDAPLIKPTPKPSRYWIVIVYARNRNVYALEGWSIDVESGAMILSDIHRSWMLDGKK